MAPSRPRHTLSGRRILVVEDEYLIADDLRRHLEGLGAQVVGPAPSVAGALALLDGLRPGPAGLDAAVLDVHLGGEEVYPVAERLRAAGVPFVFLTGYDAWAVDEAYAAVPRCEKPATEVAVRLVTSLILDPQPILSAQ